jgi:antibiotic biosynthesis monooxygenase (ABM) superfamily enzyme
MQCTPRTGCPAVTGVTAGNSRGPARAQVPVTIPTRLRSLTSAPAQQPAAEPVTVTVARVVRPEQQDAFEEWAADVQELLTRFPGNLGSSLLRPGPGSDEFHLVFRFTDDEALSVWEHSPERADALARVHRLVEDSRTARAVGLESFFAVPARPGPAWRSWLLTVAVVLAMTSTFQLVAVPFIGSWPWGLRLLLSAVYVVTALRVLMPRVSRWLGPWLQGTRRR